MLENEVASNIIQVNLCWYYVEVLVPCPRHQCKKGTSRAHYFKLFMDIYGGNVS